MANDGTTTTVYIGDLETVATSGSTTTTTTYYYAAGRRIALAVNGTLSYLASDLLGSATVSLDATGTPTASQLYAPYGGLRHQNGAMPTDYGFTGQRADSATGLDYYGARYYDPAIGQFTSADSVLDGLNRYSYVGGNPISRTDPSGHFLKPTNDQGKQIQPPQPITGQSPQGAGDDGPGGGGILPPINPVPLIKWIIDQFAIPTAYAPDGNWLDWSGNDEHTRARHLPDVVSLLDDMPYYNSRNTPRGKPTTSTPTNGGTGPHTPPTQTGGGSAGAPPGGDGVALPVNPEEDDCGCGGGGGAANNDGLGKLSGLEIRVSEKGSGLVREHLARFGQSPENEMMLERLGSALFETRPIVGADASFYMHEAYEATLMNSGVEYEAAHAASLAKYGVSPFRVCLTRCGKFALGQEARRDDGRTLFHSS